MMRVIWWGTYDTSMSPRKQILISGLVQAGVEVVNIHIPIWDDVRHKSLMDRRSSLRRFGRLLFAYPRLIAQYLAAPPHDAIITSCLGHFDNLVMWPMARIRKKPVIWDATFS